jgi:hypothetical protein
MATRNLYLVEVTNDGAGKGAFLTNRREAFSNAVRLHNDSHLNVDIWQAPAAIFKGGTSFGIDAPTFKAQATRVAHYRHPFDSKELELIGKAAQHVWQEIGGDCLQAIGEDDGSGEGATMTRDAVVEVVMDASRLEDMLKRKPYSCDEAFMRRVDNDLYRAETSTIEAYLKTRVFTFKHYGF